MKKKSFDPWTAKKATRQRVANEGLEALSSGMQPREEFYRLKLWAELERIKKRFSEGAGVAALEVLSTAGQLLESGFPSPKWFIEPYKLSVRALRDAPAEVATKKSNKRQRKDKELHELEKDQRREALLIYCIVKANKIPRSRSKIFDAVEKHNENAEKHRKTNKSLYEKISVSAGDSQSEKLFQSAQRAFRAFYENEGVKTTEILKIMLEG